MAQESPASGQGASERTPSPSSGLGPPTAISVEAVGPGLEGAHDLGRHADDVPLPDVAHLVVEAHAARAGDDDVGLLLLAMAVAPGLRVFGA